MPPYIGLLQEGNGNLQTFLQLAHNGGYNLIAAPLNYAEIPFDLTHTQLDTKYTYSDLILNSETWCTQVIPMLSETLDCDSTDPYVRSNSEKLLKRDIAWSDHVQYGGYVMLTLKGERNLNLARITTRSIKCVLLVRVPLFNKKLAQATWRSDIMEKEVEAMEEEDTWRWWHSFRRAADFNMKLRVVLELDEGDVPSEEVICRWLGEPVEAVIIPSSLFIFNRNNYPVLPKAWQKVLSRFLYAHVNMLVATRTADTSIRNYADYLVDFRNKHHDNHALKSFEDILEIPLQPLYDNLDSYTYEVFEKDPVKYRMYQDAVEAALIDRVPIEEAAEKITVIMVLGAGRGPLVRSALNAAEKCKRRVRIYIIEKNANAIRTLNAMVEKLWPNKDLHIFSKDMREFSPPEKADILVSELLGSFGDNELSPECLDCAQRLLKDDGLSIPSKSTSYINPIMSSKLLNSVRNAPRQDGFTRGKQPTFLSNYESTYVVLLKNIYNIDKPKSLFEFVHPNREQVPIDNSRFKALTFEVQMNCVMTGIGGYFDTVLYKDIVLSINPLNHTEGMASWFPMYFPMSEPIDLKAGDKVEINFWRCVSKQKVWYEWCVTAPVVTHIHNHGGHTSPIYCV